MGQRAESPRATGHIRTGPTDWEGTLQILAIGRTKCWSHLLCSTLDFSAIQFELPTSCSYILNLKKNAREYFILSLWQHFQLWEEKSLFGKCQLPDSFFTFYLINSKKSSIYDTNGVCSPHQPEFSAHCASKDKQRSGDSFTLGTRNTQEALEQLSKSKQGQSKQAWEIIISFNPFIPCLWLEVLCH